MIADVFLDHSTYAEPPSRCVACFTAWSVSLPSTVRRIFFLGGWRRKNLADLLPTLLLFAAASPNSFFFKSSRALGKPDLSLLILKSFLSIYFMYVYCKYQCHISKPNGDTLWFGSSQKKWTNRNFDLEEFALLYRALNRNLLLLLNTIPHITGFRTFNILRIDLGACNCDNWSLYYFYLWIKELNFFVVFAPLNWTRFEAGTPAIGEAIGLGAAIEYLSRIGMQRIHDYEVSSVFLYAVAYWWPVLSLPPSFLPSWKSLMVSLLVRLCPCVQLSVLPYIFRCCLAKLALVCLLVREFTI